MTTPLDVLLLESPPGTTTGGAAAQLMEAGHRIHRCHDDGDTSVPCKALADPGACPLDDSIDVALLVRTHPAPATLEDGLTCAIRAGVPVVELGYDGIGALEPWITNRVDVDADPVVACTDAVELADAPLRGEIVRRCAQLLHGASIDEADVTVQLVHRRSNLEVHLGLPGAPDKRLEHALSVRVLDALRSASKRTVGHADVYVHHHS